MVDWHHGADQMRSIARSVLGMIGGWRCIVIVTMSESNEIVTRGLAIVVKPVVWPNGLLGWISIIMALEIVLEEFQGFGIEVTITMIHIILNIFLGERIKNEDFGFVVIKVFLITMIQELNSM